MPTNADQYPSDILFDDLCRLVPSGKYPEDIEPVPEPRISGRAFFPGGDGVYLSEGSDVRPAFPVGGVMVVGRDFDTRKNFEDSRNRGSETSYIDWEKELLKASEIPLERCFFTNAFMGLRKEGSNTGPRAGQRNKVFREACATFFSRQLEVAKPRLILALGKDVAEFLAECTEQLPANWASGSWPGIDAGDGPLVLNVNFKGYTPTVPAVAALLHPSFRALNIEHRRYKLEKGELAELALMRDALESCGGADSLSNASSHATR